MPPPPDLAALLEQALTLDPAARRGFLDAACAGNDGLRGVLEDLLVAHDASSGYFEGLAEEVIGPSLAAIVRQVPEDIAEGQLVQQYRIVEKLGAGGMGIVFKALDLRLGRHVALKFLPLHLSADDAAQARFLAEAQSASALDHQNIAVVHEVGQTETGRLFIAMAYYEGETLDRRRSAWPVPQAVAIARQIGTALAAAHAGGIVHRDVKPANVLVTADGTAKLLDFGIAKLAQSDQTGPGAALGTLAYMSPEQAHGGRVDHRTDLWSLGVVLYEMLAGRRPFCAERNEALIYSIRHDPCERVDRVNPAVPRALARVVERCLAKDPERRYGRAEDLVADLDAVAAGMALPSARRRAPLLAAGLLLSGTVALAALYLARAEPVRLAVLPLSSLASAPDDYLADALTSELTAQLSGISALRVITPGGQATSQEPGAIGRELNAERVLHGATRETDRGIEVALALTDVASNSQVWSATYPGDRRTLQSLQARITRDVAGALGIRPGAAERRRFVPAGTSNPEAYVLYLQGVRFLDKGTRASANQALERFEQALDLDPEFARALSGVAHAYHELAVLGPLPSEDAYPRVRAAAEQALRLDPNLADAHVSLGNALSFYYWDFEAAAAHFRRAIELSPSHADAHQFYAEYLRYEGRFDEALASAREAEMLNPLSPRAQQEQAIILYLAGRYEEAEALLRRFLDLNPRFTFGHFFLALVHLQQQEYERALAALDAVGAGEAWHVETLRACIHAAAGRPAQARARLERLRAIATEVPGAAWHQATIHAALGEHDAALDLLEAAYEVRAWEVRLLPVEPLFEPLRSHPRFVTLVAKIR